MENDVMKGFTGHILLIVVDLLLFLLYPLNVVIGVCVQEENIVCEGLGAGHRARHPLGVLGDPAPRG